LIETLTQSLNSSLTILDLATGSGCIAIALAQAFPESRIYATDIAGYALELAEKNATYNKVSTIEFKKSDVYANIPPDLLFDLIVSNPPYIAPEEWESLDSSVSKWEDPKALAAPDHGLAIIKKIIKEGPIWLKKDRPQNIPSLVIEIGYLQGPAVKELMEQAGFKKVEIKKDLAGKDRTIWGY
jgi:release factor glutamine methyltransferase